MRYYTFKKAALAAKRAWQTLRFTEGKGYWLSGKPPAPTAPQQGEPKNQAPFTNPVPSPIATTSMFDSVDISQIPADALAIAGYVNGHWANFNQMVLKFPKAYHVSIDVNGSRKDAMCLDVEAGDATIPTAVLWVKSKLAAGAKRPIIYTSVSNAPALLRALAQAGVVRSQIRLWTAHYTFHEHLCTSACGFGFSGQADATQWHDRYLGRNLDVSRCSPTFFP